MVLREPNSSSAISDQQSVGLSPVITLLSHLKEDTSFGWDVNRSSVVNKNYQGSSGSATILSSITKDALERVKEKSNTLLVLACLCA